MEVSREDRAWMLRVARTKCITNDEAEDAVQKVCIALLDKEYTGQIRGILYTAIWHECQQNRLRAWTRKRLSLDRYDSDDLLGYDGGIDAATERLSMPRIDPKYIPLVERLALGDTQRQAAKNLNIHVRTVEAWLRKIRATSEFAL